MTVWPYLIAICAAASPFNWRASLMFAMCVCVGQATTRLELSQLHLWAGYILLAVVATYFFDRYSGFVVSAYSFVIALHVFGLLEHFPKVIAGEAMLIAGVLFCAFNGPSGGLRSNSGTPSIDKCVSSRLAYAERRGGAD